METVGTTLLPTFSKWANAVAKFLHQMNTGKKAGGDFGKALRVVGDIIRKHPVARDEADLQLADQDGEGAWST